MHRTYEAVCEGDRLEWTGERPNGKRHRVLVTVLDEEDAGAERVDEEPPSSYRSPPDRSPEEIRRILEKTRGAWGNKSADEIDRDIREMRKEWDRPWYPEVDDE